jgi:PST family polysaccharide transporter
MYGEVIKKIHRSNVAGNATFLLGLQFANYLFPLITVPYLVRVLGIDNFGLISFAIAFVQYFVIFTDYGFNLTATRSISLCRNEAILIAAEFWSVFFIKAIMMLLSICIYLALVFLIPKFNEHAAVYSCCILAIVGNFLFPVWYFQGIEKMKSIAIINIVVKFLFTIAIFVFVKTSKDYLLTILLQTGGVLFAGIIAVIVVMCRYPVSFVKPTKNHVVKNIKEGWPVFVTIMASTLVNNSNIFILGIYADTTMVGLFAVADKIVRVAINSVGPINTAIFPKVGHLFSTAKNEGVRYLRRVLKYGTILFMIVSLMLLVFADYLVLLVSGQINHAISLMIRIMSLAPLSIFIDNIYGTQVLVNIGKGKEFMKAVLFPGVMSVILSVIFVPIWKGYATAVIFIFSELTILLFMAAYVKKNGYNLQFKSA